MTIESGNGPGSDFDARATMWSIFDLVLDRSAIASCLVSLDGRFLRVNPALVSLLGVPSSELIKLNFGDLTHPEDLRGDLELFGQVISRQIDSYRLTKRYLRPDGSVIWGDLTVCGIPNDSGAVALFLSQIVDVTATTMERQAIQQAREEMRGVIDSLLDPWVLLVAVRDTTGAIIDFIFADANAAACKANRLPREQLLGMQLLELLPSHRASGLFDKYVAVVETGESLMLDDFPYPSELTDGQSRWFDNRGVKVEDGMSFTWRDTTDYVLRQQNLTEQALFDPLTGLANRVQLNARIGTAFARTPRTGDRVALLYCDLDHFKEVNDQFGHSFGDEVLRIVADRLRSTVRSEDCVARVGGDEFIVLAEGLHDEPSARLLAEKIGSAVGAVLESQGHRYVPVLSIGVALAEPGEAPEVVLDRSDRDLYRVKAARKPEVNP